MNLKRIFCRHQWEEVDSRMFTIFVVCRKCKTIANTKRAVKLVKAGKVKQLGGRA